jgi:pSer/pThr/pTyr-binding forkhead associated (FHA) protein
MFDIANLSLGVIILILRVAVVFLLYFFLWQVLRVVSHGLQRTAETPRQSASTYGRLIVESSGQTGLPVGKAFELSPVTTLGRSLDCDIALNDTFLSAEHARLLLQDGEWLVEDAGSTNGTFINGFEVRGETAIKAGDIIRIGRVELKLVQ